MKLGYKKLLFLFLLVLLSSLAIFVSFIPSKQEKIVRKSSAPSPVSNSGLFNPAKILDKNPYIQCESIIDKSIRHSCYKGASLYAISHGQKIEELLAFLITLKSPHLLEHSIGRALLITSGYDLEKARAKCASNCPGSYYHAFAEEWAEYDSSRLKDFEAFLVKYCPLDQDARVGCYHNLGHFYIGATKHLDKSFDLCDQYKRDDQFFQCSYGVVHGYFIQFGIDTYFQKCSNYSGRIQTSCYVIGSRLLPQWLSDRVVENNPLQICNDLNSIVPVEFNHCYRSIAWLLKDLKKNPDSSLCQGVDANFREFCKQGLASPEAFFDILGCSISDENNDSPNSCSTP